MKKHSECDVITNSSTVIYTYIASKTEEKLSDIVRKIIKGIIPDIKDEEIDKTFAIKYKINHDYLYEVARKLSEESKEDMSIDEFMDELRDILLDPSDDLDKYKVKDNYAYVNYPVFIAGIYNKKTNEFIPIDPDLIFNMHGFRNG
jgi:predicted house-cleaning noncanonical NTP pyrophosphatase (MazG superfamily)